MLAPAGTAGTTGASADDPATEPADGTLTPTATATPDTSGPEARLLFTEALGELAPTAVSGPSTSAADGLIGDLRADGAPVTTVDGLQYTSGPVITALSVASTHQGARDAFGFASAADTVVPDAEALRSPLASTQQADAEGAEGTGEGEQ
ncbi:hypothetical protein GCM10009755_13480 [Brevibacterium samyangense]|uniref:Uncharacterized protein n=1 Tax=Brevibacterium samyangense TaxID=366888 RepID=A0ABN2TCN7_9MICO